MSHTRSIFFDDITLSDEKGLSLAGDCFDASVYLYLNIFENQREIFSLPENEKNIVHDNCITLVEFVYASTLQQNPVKIGKKYQITCYGETRTSSSNFAIIFLQTERTKKIDARTNQFFMSGMKVSKSLGDLNIFNFAKSFHVAEVNSNSKTIKIHHIQSKDECKKLIDSQEAGIFYDLSTWFENGCKFSTTLHPVYLQDMIDYLN
jgi:hypothetical protein